MKKLIISLIAGAVLIGVGIGVMMMEIAEFSMTDTYPEIKNSPLQEFSFSDDTIFDDSDENRTVNIHGYLGEYFHDFGITEVVEDKKIDGIEVIIRYRGTKPEFRFNGYGYSTDNMYEYNLSAYSRDIMPKQILEFAEYMCQNKTIVRYQDLFYVEKVIIKTASPQLVNCEF
ncbi:MAG: hypothetical protein IKA10_09495 [Oscillospiraceae bacterium]|nr:hypothetical protein [Oscillospiraceae bacterium]